MSSDITGIWKRKLSLEITTRIQVGIILSMINLNSFRERINLKKGNYNRPSMF